jgi:50S ribosomal protein uL3
MKGFIGKKVGMTQIFDENGQVIPVTVIEAGPCYVTQIRTAENDGYTAVQLGFDELPPKRNGSSRLTKPKQGHLQRDGMSTPDLRVLREFRVREIDVQEGQRLTVNDVFEKGERVDVVGTSKGRGFAGTVKRHSFNRQPKTHGQSTASARRVRSARRRRRVAFAKGHGWPVIWATSASPFRISKSWKSMRTRICLPCVDRCRARRGAFS